MNDERTIIMGFIDFLARNGYDLANQCRDEEEGDRIAYAVYDLDLARVLLVDEYLHSKDPKIKVFNSVEDLMAHMEKIWMEQMILNDHVKPWQMELKDGDCFIYYLSDLKIWCRVCTSPYPEDQNLYREKPEIVLAKCFSEACPEGELGNIHRANITQKITLAEFELALKIFKDGPCHGSA